MNRHPAPAPDLPSPSFSSRAVSALERFLHVEAVSGIVLLIAAAAALAWANSPAAASYEAFWNAPIVFGIERYTISQPLRFWINDGLMVVFFLVVGMEIRRELHDGALADWRQASLPLAAALGGVAVPGLIYVAMTQSPIERQGWAVPTATDIAFAVGVLALLGRAVPSNVRVFLLTLAVVDDVVAVVIIAAFYSTGFDYAGLLVAGLGVVIVLGMQRMDIGSALAYVLPGVVVWGGFMMTGLHPTLAGVVLGLMTPAQTLRARTHGLYAASRAFSELHARASSVDAGPKHILQPLRALRTAQRDLVAPVTRVQMALHPWVSYVVMPLFALANAGVGVSGSELGASGAHAVTLAVFVALVAGKPSGIVVATWLAVRVGGCRLPPDVKWHWIVLIGLLAGIGFTMSIFIAMLAFNDANLLGAAKLGVLAASVTAALMGLVWGALHRRRAMLDRTRADKLR